MSGAVMIEPVALAPAPAWPGLRITRERSALLAIGCMAIVLRLVMVLRAGIYHPDEVFQYFEQAHRLVFGQGIVPWEYRYGMRSWLLPLALVPPMWAGDTIAPGTTAYVMLPRVLFALGSLSLVVSAWALGRRVSAQHGLIAAAIAATWPEFVYFAPHVLSETASIDLILPALVLLTGRAAPRRMVLAGAMLGFAAILRMQHAPAIAALVVLAMWGRRDGWRSLIAGGAAALAAGALVDLAMGQPPFGWAVEYVRQNIGHDRAAAFGVTPPWAYAQAIGQTFRAWTWPMLALAALGARRCPILLRIALINLAVHMAIGHKEYRFVLLTTAALLLLAAIGTGEAVAFAQRRWPRARAGLPWLALLGWAGASAALASAGSANRFAETDSGGPAIFSALRNDAAMCGLAVQGLHFSEGGGYTYLHRNVPMFSYAPGERLRMDAERSGFNRLIAPVAEPAPKGFSRAQCVVGSPDRAALCIFIRPGGCRAISSTNAINDLLVRLDQ